MKKIIIGIDPGISGGIAILFPSGGMVFMDSKDFNECISYITSVRPVLDVEVFIEKQWVWKNERDVRSATKLVCDYCKWIGRLEALKVPTTSIASRTWKADVLGSPNAKKERSMEFCKKEYGIKFKPSNDGLADALCIAHYGKNLATRNEV